MIDQPVGMTRCQAIAWVVTVLALASMIVDVVFNPENHAVGRGGVVLAIFAATMHVRGWIYEAMRDQKNAFDLGRDYERQDPVRKIR